MAVAALFPLLNRIDKLIEKMDEYLKAIGVIPVPPGVIVPQVVVVTPRLSNRYKVIVIDLSVAHTDEPIGVKELKPTTGYASYMTLLRMDIAVSLRINSAGADLLIGSLGMEIEDFEIEEIYITNAAGAPGQEAHFYLEYRSE